MTNDAVESGRLRDPMSSPASPAETRAYIIERLVGETGEPDHVIEAARALAERAIPAMLAPLNDVLGSPVGIDDQERRARPLRQRPPARRRQPRHDDRARRTPRPTR